MSVPINPGNLRTSLARDQTLAIKVYAHAIVYPIINGVYTQLFAAFPPEEEGGNGSAQRFWEWNEPNEEQVKNYL